MLLVKIMRKLCSALWFLLTTIDRISDSYSQARHEGDASFNEGQLEMKVKELRAVLTELEAIYEAAGAVSPARGLENLIDVLGGDGEEEVDSFLDDIRRLFVGSKSSTRAGLAPLDEVAVERYARRLLDAGTNARAFAVVINELKSDKKIRRDEAGAILQCYIGGRESWRSKGEAIDALERRFEGRRLDANRQRLGGSISAW